MVKIKGKGKMVAKDGTCTMIVENSVEKQEPFVGSRQ